MSLTSKARQREALSSLPRPRGQPAQHRTQAPEAKPTLNSVPNRLFPLQAEGAFKGHLAGLHLPRPLWLHVLLREGKGDGLTRGPILRWGEGLSLGVSGPSARMDLQTGERGAWGAAGHHPSSGPTHRSQGSAPSSVLAQVSEAQRGPFSGDTHACTCRAT